MIWGLAVGAALLAAVIVGGVLRKVRIDDPEAPNFRALATWRGALAVAAVGFAVMVFLGGQPALHLPVWFAYVGLGLPLVYVDLRTTWLPKKLHWLAAGGMAAAILVLVVVEWRLAVGPTLGSLAAGTLLYLAWRMTSTLGFGDVRLGFLVGAVAALGGATGWAYGLLAGTILGALHGIGHALWARRDPARPQHFPYGPALWLGPVIAAIAA